jgi:uncharacterized protein YcbK (DUF882 family)
MDRRIFLSLIAGTALLPEMVRAVPLPPPQPHRLSLTNPHTGETFSGFYRDDNGPIPRVMEELSVFLRDFHSGEKIGIDVAVLDFLSSVMQASGQQSATIFSAYRTPETNAKLSKTHFGVAENSQHMYGRALDVHFGDKLEEAMKTARSMQRGGVGWYPHSSFMHIDSGPVRNWDLDHPKLVTLLVANRKVQFNKKGDMLVGKRGNLVAAKAQKAVLRNQVGVTVPGGESTTTSVLRGEGPLSVRDRLARLRTLARAQYLARKP